MQPGTALIIAILTGAAAVGVVAVDLTYTLTARLESFVDGEWRVFGETPQSDAYGSKFPGYDLCASPQLRLIVDNHRPLDASVSVRITYWNQTVGRTTEVYADDWRLDAFDSRIHEFTVQGDGSSTPPSERPAFPGEEASVTVAVGELGQLYQCVHGE